MAGNKTYKKININIKISLRVCPKQFSLKNCEKEKRRKQVERNGESGIGSRRAAEGYRAPGGEG